MLQAANTDLLNRESLKLTIVSVKSYCFLAIKPVSQLKLVCGFLFFEPSGLIG